MIIRAGASRAKTRPLSVRPGPDFLVARQGGAGAAAVPSNGIAWIYGAGGIQYVFARDPKLDVTTYKPDDHKERLLQVSRLMDFDQSD